MSSEIFDEYIRIATEKGLISTAETDPLKETNPRYDSQDISTIEALYGVKPNDEPKGYRNIIETAHPESVHIAPSHDKINGLVENNNELHDILVNIVARPPSGSIAYRKLAEQNLVMELIRVANHLDNVGEEDLRILADSCIETFEKKKVKNKPLDTLQSFDEYLNTSSRSLNKQAIGPLAIVAVVGIIAFVAYLKKADIEEFLVKQQINGVSTKQKIIEAIEKLTYLDDDDHFYTDKIDAQAKKLIESAISALKTLQADMDPFIALINSIDAPDTLDEIKEKAQDAQMQAKAKQIDDYRKKLVELITLLTKDSGIIAKLKDENYKIQHTISKSWLEKIPLILFTDKWKEAAVILDSVSTALKEQLSVLNKAKNYEELYKQRIIEHETKKTQVDQDIDALDKPKGDQPNLPEPSAPTPSGPSAGPASPSGGDSGTDDDDLTIDFSKF